MNHANTIPPVFGMTNMPPNNDFKSFGIVFAVTCVPTYMLIGSLNTTSGLQFWSSKTNHLLTWIGHSFAALLAQFGFKPKWTHAYHTKMKDHPSTFEDHSYPVGNCHVSLILLTNVIRSLSFQRFGDAQNPVTICFRGYSRSWRLWVNDTHRGQYFRDESSTNAGTTALDRFHGSNN